MKRLLLLLLIITPLVHSQTDCGNCWLIGFSCNSDVKSSECYTPGVPCQECAWHYDCDDHACAYSTGVVCVCIALNAVQCKEYRANTVPRRMLLRQQLKNRSIIAHV